MVSDDMFIEIKNMNMTLFIQDTQAQEIVINLHYAFYMRW